jgi:hypothetical protein
MPDGWKKIDLNCSMVTKPTALCHVAWLEKNSFILILGSQSPLHHVMSHGRVRLD